MTNLYCILHVNMEPKKRNFTVEKKLELAKKRGNVYKYPLKIDDIPKMPRFTDADFRYHILDNAYKIWKGNIKNALWFTGFRVRDFQKTWKIIADAIFEEMEDNLDGVLFPEQLGMLYIGTPPNKEYFSITNRENYKHIIWRNRLKYTNKNLNYYFFHSFHKRYKSAMAREEYYKTAREKIPMNRKKLK